MPKVKISVKQTIEYRKEIDIDDDHLFELQAMNQHQLNEELGSFVHGRRNFMHDIQNDDGEVEVLNR